MAAAPPGQSICYSCGRVITGSQGMMQRSQGYQQAASTRGSKRGKHTVEHKAVLNISRRKKKKGRVRNLVMLGAIVAVFTLTPLQEEVLGQWAQINEMLADASAARHTYPAAVTYTVDRTVTLSNEGTQTAQFHYRLPVPAEERTAKPYSGWRNEEWGYVKFDSQGVNSALNNEADFGSIQTITSMTVNGISIPIGDFKGYDMTNQGEVHATPLPGGEHKIWWQEMQPLSESGHDYCVFGPCVHWEGDLRSGSILSITVRYTVEGKSFTWWNDPNLDLQLGKKIGRLTVGMNAENSGNLEDISDGSRTLGLSDYNQYYVNENQNWFDRASSGAPDYAITGGNQQVKTVAQSIRATLPAGENDNAFSLAHASFVYVRDNVEYTTGLAVPRSGTVCLTTGLGDCDEQSNAWMSILRVLGIPTWYEFGALTTSTFDRWEGHGWANVALPYSDEACAEWGVDIRSCYIEGSVDVVNNKFLLHTPTAFSEWIEPPPQGDSDGKMIESFYGALQIGSSNYAWDEHWSTVGSPEVSGGTYNVRLIEGE